MNSAVLLFDRTARRLPGKTAVVDEWGEITFEALRRNAMAAGTALLRGNAGKRGLVPAVVYLPKSIGALTAYLGTLYSGNPYVPVDAHIPMKRLQAILDGLGPCCIITNEELSSHLEALDLHGAAVHRIEALAAGAPDEAAVMAAVDAVIDSDPIYVMFTSGSTGVPKGVTIPHRGILDYSLWLEETFGFSEDTVLGNQSAFYFDNSTFDIYTMCRTGATLHLIPEILYRFPNKLMEYVKEQHINTIFWVPTVMISVANADILDGLALPELQKVLFCGEAMPNKQLNVWRRAFPNLLYANLYGPTEITDVCTCYVVDRPFQDSDPLPIGKACRNMRALVLRPDGSECAPGETGDLCILGSGLARGYWNAPELTRGAFVQNPLSPCYDDRMYRTGDLAYWGEDGNLIFVGRADSQIKFRGNRIELGEIETAARSLPDIKNAVAVFDAEREEIVLFAETDAELKLRKLNVELKKIVPSYMVPTRLVCMKELPQTPNGKIDRVLLKSICKES